MYLNGYFCKNIYHLPLMVTGGSKGTLGGMGQWGGGVSWAAIVWLYVASDRE